MTKFPTERKGKHRLLMQAVEHVRPILEDGASEGEETATLPRASADALYESGLFRLKLPTSLEEPKPTWLRNWTCWRRSAR